MKRINVLFLDNTSTFGGAINSLVAMLKLIDTNKINPILISSHSENFIYQKLPNVLYFKINIKNPWDIIFFKIKIIKKILIVPLFKIPILIIFRIYWYFFYCLPEVVKYYYIGKSKDVQIVHLNNIWQIPGIIVSKLLGAISVSHARDFIQISIAEKFVSKFIDHHVVVSNSVKENLINLGIPDSRITLVYDAIDLDEFSDNVDSYYLLKEFYFSTYKLRVGIFGRIIDWKGIREFIYAIDYIAKDFPDIVAFVVGGPSDGDENFLSEMVQLSKDLGLTDRIIFTGYRQDIPALMKFMDVIVHASNKPEPFGMVLIEGMAMSKPIVATRGGGPLDIVVEGETGYLVNMNDAVDLGKAICTLLQQPDLRIKMGLAGRKRVESEFNNRRYAKQMEEVFHRFNL